MTKDDILALIENLEEAAIEFGEKRYGSQYDRVSARTELREARDELKAAIRGLYYGIAKNKTDA